MYDEAIKHIIELIKKSHNALEILNLSSAVSNLEGINRDSKLGQ